MQNVIAYACAVALSLASVHAQSGRLTSGRATLFDRSEHRSYERATFSFEHGVRDGVDITKNDWDLLFQRGTFSVNTVADDRSRIVDLGEKTFAQIDAIPKLPARTEAGAVNAPAVVDHMYVIHTKDTNSDHFSLFRVAKIDEKGRCAIEWVHWRRRQDNTELRLDAKTRAKLSRLLNRVHYAEEHAMRRRLGVIRDPQNIVLQLRTGAQGGNRSRLTLRGPANQLPETSAAQSLDMSVAPKTQDQAAWHINGGLLPNGMALLIEAIDVFAHAPGDSNGPGSVRVSAAGQTVFHAENDNGPLQVWHEGKTVLMPGQEDRFIVEAANSSAVEVRIRGRFLVPDVAERIEAVRFAPAQPPNNPKLARAGGVVQGARDLLMKNGVVVLQIRAGAGGGNPNRVSMIGKASAYVDRMSSKPLSFDRPVTMQERATAYFAGGRIPRGKVFEIQSIRCRGTARGDSNGSGELILKVMGETIVSARNSKTPIKKDWKGSITVAPGQEDMVVLEVANSSTANVRIQGRLVPRK